MHNYSNESDLVDYYGVKTENIVKKFHSSNECVPDAALEKWTSNRNKMISLSEKPDTDDESKKLISSSGRIKKLKMLIELQGRVCADQRDLCPLPREN